MTTYAYCSDAAALLPRSGHDRKIGTINGTASSRRCPRGTHPLAGGFEQPDAITGFAGNAFRDFVPYTSRRSGRRWSSSGQHRGTTTSTLASTAYCG